MPPSASCYVDVSDTLNFKLLRVPGPGLFFSSFLRAQERSGLQNGRCSPIVGCHAAVVMENNVQPVRSNITNGGDEP